MLESLKKFLNWPTKGISNISDFGNYCKANWLSLLIMFIGVLILIWIIRKIFSFIGSMFKD
ncbi:MAG: hypothetical protein MRERV_3c068 [Mycoplasmataceae bacterium RV_VA103A]|nr:MAG: hypothetical protein MRERV_3c068 [Mycoplasmataceae bacterium RV_VA103A]